MFGITKPQQSCSNETDAYYTMHRLHYCGTCKALGKDYGQSARMLLNYDTVFMAELMEQLNPTQGSWERKLQTANTCLHMPERPLPFSLQYAAATTMVLTALKTDDAIKDSKKWRAKALQSYFNNSFEKAFELLEQQKVAKSYILQQVETQESIEKEKVITGSIEETLLHYAEPTALITQHLFEQASPEAECKTMGALGYTFGQLAYTLDAFEDFEQDVFKSEFNAIALHHKQQRTLKDTQAEVLRTFLKALNDKMCSLIQQLPISADWQLQFTDRLTSNLYLRIYKERIVPKTFIEKIEQRWSDAHETANRFFCTKNSLTQQLQFYIVVFAVFLNPQTSAYLPASGKTEVISWMGIITAGLGGVGLLLHNKKKGRWKRFKRRWKALKLALKMRKANKTGCIEVIISECCAACCDACCQSCCDQGCDTCNDILSDAWDESPKKFFSILFIGVFIIAALIALLIIL